MNTPIFEAARDHFKNSPRNDLRNYAQVLGVEYKHVEDDDLRKQLLAKLGQASVVATDKDGNALREVEHETLGIQDVDQLWKLELSGRGVWQGRRNIVKIQAPQEYAGIYPQIVVWGRQEFWIRYDREVSVPRPVRNILHNAVVNKYRHRWVKRDDGSTGIQWYTTRRDRFSLSDLGDDPETKRLPISQKDQFSQIADLTEDFTTYPKENGEKGEFTKRAILKVARRLNVPLHERVKLSELNRWEFSDLRDAALRRIGREGSLV